MNKYDDVVDQIKIDADFQDEADMCFDEVLTNLEKKKFTWGYVQGLLTDIGDIYSDSIEQKLACHFLHLMCFMPYRMRKRILNKVYMSRREMFQYRCSHKTPATRYF